MASIVAFRAHPDDEVLLVGGTLALLAAAGHDVLVVLATDGGAGLAAPDARRGPLGATRLAEAQTSCAALGLPPPSWLGFRDSGEAGPPPTASFLAAPSETARDRLAAILRDRRADALIVDDRAGGYGHRDHRRAHQVGVAAAASAAVAEVYEATVDRTSLRRAVGALRVVPGVPAGFRAQRLHDGFSAREEITHRLDVRAFCEQKRAAIAAHATQAAGGADARTLAVFAALPLPVFRAVLGREWFIRRGQQPGRRREGALTLPPARPLP